MLHPLVTSARGNACMQRGSALSQPGRACAFLCISIALQLWPRCTCALLSNCIACCRYQTTLALCSLCITVLLLPKSCLHCILHPAAVAQITLALEKWAFDGVSCKDVQLGENAAQDYLVQLLHSDSEDQGALQSRGVASLGQPSACPDVGTWAFKQHMQMLSRVNIVHGGCCHTIHADHSPVVSKQLHALLSSKYAANAFGKCLQTKSLPVRLLCVGFEEEELGGEHTNSAGLSHFSAAPVPSAVTCLILKRAPGALILPLDACEGVGVQYGVHGLTGKEISRCITGCQSSHSPPIHDNSRPVSSGFDGRNSVVSLGSQLREGAHVLGGFCQNLSLTAIGPIQILSS
eukprot:1142097-Pelagomonas_calceolata.AAC.3